MEQSKYSGGGRGSRQMMGGRGGRNRFQSKNYLNKTQNKNEYEKKTIPPTIELSNPLSSLQTQYFSSIFPNDIVKLSYETVAPKKVSSPEYDLCLAIPFGKKAYIWFTYYYSTSICLLLELNRENQIGDHISCIASGINIPKDFELGTIVSGTIYEKEIDPDVPIDPNAVTERIFIVDDIHLHKGLSISKFVFREKTGFIYDFFLRFTNANMNIPNISIKLPVLWNPSSNEQPVDIPYNIRHIQYRCTNKILPHLNVTMNRKPVWCPTITIDSSVYIKDYKFDYGKPIYKKSAYFYVKPDIAYDVYYLGALDMNGNIVYFQHLLIMNYNTSILLNSLFRNIRENQNLDAIEESDDEEDFENIREDKYVDLEKIIVMECVFHSKFRRWMPIGISNEKSTLLHLLL
jgi:hypothetical protein